MFDQHGSIEGQEVVCKLEPHALALVRTFIRLLLRQIEGIFGLAVLLQHRQEQALFVVE